MGLPHVHRRYIHLHFNGLSQLSREPIDSGVKIYEDAEQINSSYVQSRFSQDSRGELFKIDKWLEFALEPPHARRIFLEPPSLANFMTTDGQKKLARYRWTWA